MKEFDFDFESCKKISEKDFEELVKNGCMPKKGDILLSKDGTMGLSILYQNSNEIVILSSIAILKTKKNFSNYFLKIFLSRKNNLSVLIGGYSSGSALPRIVLKDLKNFKILVPSEKILNEFDTIANPLFNKIFSSFNQVNQLTKIRDALLPKLMSGQIRV